MKKNLVWLVAIVLVVLALIYFFGIRNQSPGTTERPSSPANCNCSDVTIDLSLTNTATGTSRKVTATATVMCAGQPWKVVPVKFTFPSPGNTREGTADSRPNTDLTGVATANRTYTGSYNPVGESVTAMVTCDGTPGRVEVTKNIPQ